MSPSAQRGFATTLVIVVLVMLAVLGTSLAVISNTQQASHALDIQGVKAYHAARAGLEWAMYNVLRSGGAGCGAVNGAAFALDGNLADFRVSTACAQSVHQEAGTTTVYQLSATACNDASCPTAASPPSPYYVERQLRVTVGSD